MFLRNNVYFLSRKVNWGVAGYKIFGNDMTLVVAGAELIVKKSIYSINVAELG